MLYLQIQIIDDADLEALFPEQTTATAPAPAYPSFGHAPQHHPPPDNDDKSIADNGMCLSLYHRACSFLISIQTDVTLQGTKKKKKTDVRSAKKDIITVIFLVKCVF